MEGWCWSVMFVLLLSRNSGGLKALAFSGPKDIGGERGRQVFRELFVYGWDGGEFSFLAFGFWES